MHHLHWFLVDEQATESMEWGIIVGFFVVGLVLTFASIGSWIKGPFEKIETSVAV